MKSWASIKNNACSFFATFKNVMLESKWKTVLIKSPYTELTKYDVYSYYSDPYIKSELLKDLDKHLVAVRQVLNNREIFKRHDPSGKFIKITHTGDDVDNPRNLVYWTHRRTTEFHKTIPGNKTDHYIVDIDPGSQVPFNETKKLALIVNELLKNRPDVSDTEIRFSGGRGFYVIGKLKNKRDIDRARNELRRMLSELEKYDLPITFSPPGPRSVRLDLSPMKRMGSYRAKYSLNGSTGLVSVPLTPEQVVDFKKIDALPIRILNYRIPEVKILR